jgi:large subunit ribosomal protein L10
MNRDEKAAVVEEIAGQIQSAEAIFAVDYRGLTVAQAAELRVKLRDSDASFRVVKNSLTERAADRAGAEALKEFLVGPTALTVVRGDAALAAKTLNDTARALRGLLAFKGGLMNGATLSAQDVTAIARLPSRDVLHAQLVGTIAAPLVGLVRGLNAVLAGIAVQLQQILEQRLTGGEELPVAVAEPEAPVAVEPEAVVVAEPEPEAAAEPEPEPEAVAEPEPEPEAVAEPEPEPAPEPEAAAEPEPEAAAEPEPEAAAEPEPEPEPEAAAEPEPEPEPEAAAEPEPEPEAAAEPEPEPEVAAKPEAAAEPDPEPEPEAATEPEPTPEPEAAAKPEAAPEPEAAAVTPEPAPEPTTEEPDQDAASEDASDAKEDTNGH